MQKCLFYETNPSPVQTLLGFVVFYSKHFFRFESCANVKTVKKKLSFVEISKKYLFYLYEIAIDVLVHNRASKLQLN